MVALGHILQGEAGCLHSQHAGRAASTIEATGLDETGSVGLLMKLIYTWRIEQRGVRRRNQAADASRDEADPDGDGPETLYAKGVRPDNAAAMNYAMTEEGQRWAMDALQRSQYTGPAPVTLEEYCDRVNLQKITNEIITF